MKKIIALAVSIAMIPGAASAERFLRIDAGSARVNHGAGFALATDDTPLAPGDLVKVSRGGAARVISGDQPPIRIGGGRLYRVPAGTADQDAAQADASGLAPPELFAPVGLGVLGAAAGVAVATTGKAGGAQPLIGTPNCASAGC